jgi:thioredoxin 1
MVAQITSEKQFKDLISSSKLTLVDWYADWCGPCKAIAPEFESMSKSHPQVQFCKVNVDTFPVNDYFVLFIKQF